MHILYFINWSNAFIHLLLQHFTYIHLHSLLTADWYCYCSIYIYIYIYISLPFLKLPSRPFFISVWWQIYAAQNAANIHLIFYVKAVAVLNGICYHIVLIIVITLLCLTVYCTLLFLLQLTSVMKNKVVSHSQNTVLKYPEGATIFFNGSKQELTAEI